MNIAVDFDGTIVTHEYPNIGRERPFAISTLKMIQKEGHNLVLWTVREDELLQEAIDWCKKRGLEFYAVNKDYPEESLEADDFSRKLKVDIWIDDRNVGGLPSWGEIYQIIHNEKTYEEVLADNQKGLDGYDVPKRKHWWKFW